MNTTTDDLIAEIEAAAKAATPGDWKAKGTLFGEWSISTDYTTEGKRLENGRQLIAFSPAASKTNAPVYAAMFEANAKHMALCNPANVLALIAELRSLRADAERYRKALEDVRWRIDDTKDQLTAEGFNGERRYGLDEWSGPIINLTRAVGAIDAAMQDQKCNQ